MSPVPPDADAAPLTVVEQSGPDSLRRLVTVQPGMCGPGSLLIGRIGDWSWETVSAVCGTDVLNARDCHGRPAYLSFYYYRLRTGSGDTSPLHPGDLRFGDRLEVDSRVFGFGGESALILHRLRRLAPGEPPHRDSLTAEEFYDRPQPGCLYAENFNHWISRGRPDSNLGLIRSAPPDFTHDHLPVLPERYSPTTACRAARRAGRFTEAVPHGSTPTNEEFTVDYPVDLTRDVNGVGLLYFASYFSIADYGLLRLWRRLGRSDDSFLRRKLVDSRMCYLGNADLDTHLRLRMHPWHGPPGDEEVVVDLTIEDTTRERTLALGAFRLRVDNTGA
ncbi:LnmK family bifunctional acyltransferase/decarboxylase [Streptomyces sp. NPDC048484]|uniref:LnmK family bifunctional acyltransferase/decarboxylase n=1 Tax=Streptomyces sp. NPDC048484 TaxID=3155146 RepID=UPI003417B1BF